MVSQDRVETKSLQLFVHSEHSE